MSILNLNKVETGRSCCVRWLTGKAAEIFRNDFSLSEDTDLYVVKNHGKGGMIVRYDDKRLAISSDAADYVKVECA